MKSEQRMLLAVALSVAIFYVWGKWFAPPSPTPPASAPTTAAEAPAASAPVVSSAPAPVLSKREPSQSDTPIQDVTLRGEKSSLTLSNDGGIPRRWLLADYQIGQGKTEAQIDLITALETAPLQMELSGLEEFFPARPIFEINRQNDQTVIFSWRSDQLAVEKTYQLEPNNYTAHVTIKVTNLTTVPLQGRLGLRWEIFNRQAEKRSGFFAMFLPPTDQWNPLYFADGSVNRMASADAITKKGSFEGAFSWAGFENRYFLAALLPQEASLGARITTEQAASSQGDQVALRLFTAPTVFSPGSAVTQSFIVYAGPKDIESLKPLGVGLDEAIDYGIFSVVAIPILYLLKFFYAFVHNYGVAIILLTLLIKLLLHPVTKISLQSMRKMQLLQPELKALREKFKDDKQRVNTEMMQLFQRNKVNPMSGCLPMVLQIPVYIALYKVLWNSVELYRAPFFWFYRDLSGPDPYFISPILLGVAFFLQQKLTPSPTMDPAQRKMMMIMPIMFTAFMVFLPSGLVIYILINTLYSVLQQWLTNRGLGLRDLLRGRLAAKT